MINLNDIILKENYTLNNLMKENRVIFFDIDSTLGSNTTHHGLARFESYQKQKKDKLEAFNKSIGINFDGANYQAVDINCLALFLKTLKETNSVAFCISSWMVSCCVRGDTINLNPITLIEKVFQEEFPEWEGGIIVGGYYQEPDTRGEFCKELSKIINTKYFVIDDSYARYNLKENLIEVDGNSGYGYNNHIKIKNAWI